MLIKLSYTITISLALLACGHGGDLSDKAANDKRLETAEGFIDAFYSFNPLTLRSTLSSAQDSIPLILFYQGWAEGGNYEITERKPCKLVRDQTISCSITVRDDLIQALGINFNVTDTFHLNFSGKKIVSVNISSNDPQEFNEAHEWVEKKHPEIFSGPCKGFFNGGATPGDCVRAMVVGYAEFAEENGLKKRREESD